MELSRFFIFSLQPLQQPSKISMEGAYKHSNAQRETARQNDGAINRRLNVGQLIVVTEDTEGQRDGLLKRDCIILTFKYLTEKNK